MPFWQNEPNDGDRFDQLPADASVCHNSKAPASSKGFFVVRSNDIVCLHTTKTTGLSHAREHGELYYGVA